MDKKVVFQAAALASLLALVGVIVQIIAGGSLPSGVQPQPPIPLPINQLVQAGNEHPDTVLAFFAGDSLFLLSYLLVFVGLYHVTSERTRTFALLGLGAEILTAFLDASENAFYITYALSAKAGLSVTTPDVPIVYLVTNLKWMAAFATLYAFGIVFPRRNAFEWVIAGLMLLFPLVGILGVAIPSLIAIRGLFFLVGMPVFAVYFWQQAKVVN